ncbi:MAG: hypothetical protein OXU75_14515 [Deltaproteobacteria bacterium]|nr:hypothetical protein [Deltaproteobacteria bacterium]
MSDDLKGKALKKGKRFGSKVWGRVKAGWAAYPAVMAIMFFVGRWTAWIPLFWGL